MSIKIGDVVTLKCNEIRMVVDEINYSLPSNSPIYICKWHTDNGYMQTSALFETSLNLVESKEPLVIPQPKPSI